jgi:hypothetical protein
MPEQKWIASVRGSGPPEPDQDIYVPRHHQRPWEALAARADRQLARAQGLHELAGLLVLALGGDDLVPGVPIPNMPATA